MRDLYEILMVHEKAIPEVIDGVYRLLARRYHPDVHPPEQRTEAERRMTELNLAYQVLSDPVRRSEYDRKRRMGLHNNAAAGDMAAVDLLLKCFNHPRRSAAGFCWDCGRPICDECMAPNFTTEGLPEDINLGRTICTTCLRHSQDLASRIRAGRRANPRGRWFERPMGVRGALAYYAIIGALVAGICGFIFWAARQVGAGDTQAAIYAAVVGTLYFLLVAYRLSLRVECPNCKQECGPVDFRCIAPWKDILRPHPVCPRCSRHFLKQEVSQPFE